MMSTLSGHFLITTNLSHHRLHCGLCLLRRFYNIKVLSGIMEDLELLNEALTNL